MMRLIVIAGPTASGKTNLSVKLAQQFQSEIISADSRQFYKEMNTGTAKPTVEQLGQVPHHFVNSLSINEDYNAGRFETDALLKITELFSKHEILFLVGGSGLYIDAVCKGIDDLPATIPEVREKLNQFYMEKGIDGLRQRLQEEDPEYLKIADINNPHRLIRALEVKMSSGKKFSSLRRNKIKQRNFETRKIGLIVEREELYDRIHQRVDKMISDGLVSEVERLLPFKNTNALQTVGYRELIDYFENKTSLEEAVNLIKQNTRNYAKRQMTWFRRDPEISWYAPEEFEKIQLRITGDR